MKIIAGLVGLLIPVVSVSTDADFTQIMEQPPLIRIHDCQHLVDNAKQYNKCLMPYLKTAHCRARGLKIVFADENNKKLTQDQLEEEFLEFFNKCFESY